MPGSSNDGKPPAVPPKPIPLAIDDRKRESEAKPLKKPRSEDIIAKKPKVRTAPVPEAPIAKKPKQALAIQDIPIKPKQKHKKDIPEPDIPIKSKFKLKDPPENRKVAIQILDAPTKKKPANTELNQATKEAVKRLLRNQPARSKPQVITTNVDGLKKEIEDILEQTAKRRTGMSIKDMEFRRGVKA